MSERTEAGDRTEAGGRSEAGDRTARRARASRAVRRWRLPALLAAGVLIAGGVIALLQRPPVPVRYLDPAGTGQSGGHALADLATARGQVVVRTQVPEITPQGMAPAVGGALELITSPGQLTVAQLRQAAAFDGDILLVAPDTAALRAIAPGAGVTGHEGPTVAEPQCGVPAAVLAGGAYVDGAVLATSVPGAQVCYPDGGGHWLVRYSSGGSRTVTVIGSGTPFTNEYLADDGDAALGLNLLGSAQRIVWVVPSAASAGAGTQGSGQGGQQSFLSLVPWPVYLIVIQLCVAALLAAAWRARRLGPLVAERLPVVVRAAETTEGHGRLYHARRARDRAAEELRAAAVARLARFAGLGAPETGGPGTGAHRTDGRDAAAEAVAARAGLPAPEVAALLHGPPPATDQDLVNLAADLDQLERKIRQS
jgi:Domain of unknown function (DUF4350)